MRSGETERRIECVCFDLGGVLVRIARSWSDACRAAGLDVRGASAGDAAARVRSALMHEFGLGLLSENEWSERLALALDRSYSTAELAQIHHAWSGKEYEGALDLVDALNTLGIATACLSNTNAAHWRRLIHHDGARPLLGAPEYPSVARLQKPFASHLLGVAKPNKAIYRAFEERSGHRGATILFFDDLIENVEAARSLGWRAERIDPSVETVPQLRRLLTRHGVL